MSNIRLYKKPDQYTDKKGNIIDVTRLLLEVNGYKFQIKPAFNDDWKSLFMVAEELED